jgi:hypothetical protein
MSKYGLYIVIGVVIIIAILIMTFMGGGKKDN